MIRYAIIAPVDYYGLQAPMPVFRSELASDGAYMASFKLLADADNTFKSSEDARRAHEALSAYYPHLVIIRVAAATNASSSKELIGYDVASSNGWHSLLSWGLHWPRTQKEGHLGALLELVEAFFHPLRNERGLFDNYKTAEMFVRVVNAIQHFVPNVWESPGTFVPTVYSIETVSSTNA